MMSESNAGFSLNRDLSSLRSFELAQAAKLTDKSSQDVSRSSAAETKEMYWGQSGDRPQR